MLIYVTGTGLGGSHVLTHLTFSKNLDKIGIITISIL